MRSSAAKPTSGFLGRAIAVFSAASAVASRVEARRRPDSSDLLRLGIDPSTFPDVTRI